MINLNEFGIKFSEKLTEMTEEQRIAYLKKLGFSISKTMKTNVAASRAGYRSIYRKRNPEQSSKATVKKSPFIT